MLLARKWMLPIPKHSTRNLRLASWRERLPELQHPLLDALVDALVDALLEALLGTLVDAFGDAVVHGAMAVLNAMTAREEG